MSSSSPQEENLDFVEHQDLSSLTLTELQQLLQMNTQTSNHYSMQIAATDVPSDLKNMYQMSKDIVDSDINDIHSEIEKRNSTLTKNDISSSTTFVSTVSTISNIPTISTISTISYLPSGFSSSTISTTSYLATGFAPSTISTSTISLNG